MTNSHNMTAYQVIITEKIEKIRKILENWYKLEKIKYDAELRRK